MGSGCSCKANQVGPEYLLGTENERRTVQQNLYAPVMFKNVPTLGDEEEGLGMIENKEQAPEKQVEEMASGHLKHHRLGLDGVTTRPRVVSGVVDAFKALFTKDSVWIGKLKFSLEEGISEETVLEYKVTGKSTKGDVKGERIVRKKLPGRPEHSPMYDVDTLPCKIEFDIFYPTGEDPVMIFKCEDRDLVLVVDTRVNEVNSGFDIKQRYVEGIGYRKDKRSESKSFDPDTSSDSETFADQKVSSVKSRSSKYLVGLPHSVSVDPLSMMDMQSDEEKQPSSDDEKAHEIRRHTRSQQSQRPAPLDTGEFYLQRVVCPPGDLEDPLERRPSDYAGALDRLSSAYLYSPYRKPAAPICQQKQEPIPEHQRDDEKQYSPPPGMGPADRRSSLPPRRHSLESTPPLNPRGLSVDDDALPRASYNRSSYASYGDQPGRSVGTLSLSLNEEERPSIRRSRRSKSSVTSELKIHLYPKEPEDKPEERQERWEWFDLHGPGAYRKLPERRNSL